LKSTETHAVAERLGGFLDFSNFGSLKSTETQRKEVDTMQSRKFQQFRLVEEH